MTTDANDVVITIAGPNDETEVALPESLFDALSNEEETASDVVSDILVLSCAQRVHALVHHGEEEIDEDLSAVEDRMMAVFEEHFGMTFAQATGHDH
ncbi:DUF7545 family protein [Halocatena pleomorpha]|uniref:Uncharacterized protein n=1 Tax=Halocatena pleomorpha TaxID=1785090 RepID=A0A3P3RL35_9EURY|nr:hypothetical protein [Halocatena pleomorpha]RRJ33608.1 hypothetical protein EIK79_02075 [Halocatena pleomorpha]